MNPIFGYFNSADIAEDAEIVPLAA